MRRGSALPNLRRTQARKTPLRRLCNRSTRGLDSIDRSRRVSPGDRNRLLRTAGQLEQVWRQASLGTVRALHPQPRRARFPRCVLQLRSTCWVLSTLKYGFAVECARSTAEGSDRQCCNSRARQTTHPRTRAVHARRHVRRQCVEGVAALQPRHFVRPLIFRVRRRSAR